MTPVERLQAARNKLVRLQVFSEDAPWEPKDTDSPRRLYSGIGSPEEVLVLKTQEDNSAELVAVLHRTVDAQLRVLNHAIARLEQTDQIALATDTITGVNVGPLEMADAILGSDL